VGRYVIEQTARTSAEPATVYRLLRDGSTWPDWSMIDEFELESAGDDQPEGVGAVRMFRNGRIRGRDRVIGFEQDRQFRYIHLGGLPVRNYEGRIDLTPDNGGTVINWRVTFDAKFFGTGMFVHRALTKFIADGTQGLAKYAATL
jgi:hypothetical protein